MPDLTLESWYYCSSIENFHTKIKDYTVSHGPSNGQYMYDWTCECKGFKYRGKCKHIEQAKAEFCGWDQFIEGDDSPEDGKCPKCGMEAKSRMIGV